MTKNDIKRALFDLIHQDTQGPPDPKITDEFLTLLGAAVPDTVPDTGGDVDLSPFVRKDGSNMSGALTIDTNKIVLNAEGSAVFSGSVEAVRFQTTSETLVYNANTALDFSTAGWKSVSLTGNITFTSLNVAADREIAVRIVSDGSSRTLTFPAGWVFVSSAAPASIAANKTAILSLRAFGGTDSTVVASYVVQP